MYRLIGMCTVLGLLVGAVSMAAGCEEGPLERAGERADEAAEDAAETVEDAADEAEDAIDDKS